MDSATGIKETTAGGQLQVAHVILRVRTADIMTTHMHLMTALHAKKDIGLSRYTVMEPVDVIKKKIKEPQRQHQQLGMVALD